MEKFKQILSLLLTIIIIATLLYFAIWNNSEKNLEDTSGLTQIVGHTHNVIINNKDEK